MNKERLYVFIIILCLCILSVSMVSAADNTTANVVDDSGTDDTVDKSVKSADAHGSTASISDFRKDIIEAEGSLNISRNYEYDEVKDSNISEKGLLFKNSDLVIYGNNHSIDLKGKSSLFTLNNSRLNISNFIIKNTLHNALHISKTNLTTNDVTFINNHQTESNAVNASNSIYLSSHDNFINLKNMYGSAIYASNSYIRINNDTFNINSLQEWGAVYARNSNIYVLNTEFTNMKSKYSTAIYLSGGQMAVYNSTFSNLEAIHTAGAIAAKNIENTITIYNCNFTNITANNNGGMLFFDITGNKNTRFGSVVISNSTFTQGISLFGGAVIQLGGLLKINNSTFTENFASIKGGALYLSDVSLKISDSSFIENSVFELYDDYNHGGAIYYDYGSLEIDKTVFRNNTALEGSDMYLRKADYTISNSYFGEDIYTEFDRWIPELNNNTFMAENTLNDKNYYYVYETNSTAIAYNPVILDPSCVNDTYFNLAKLNLSSPVKNQGNMGSCWTFGVTGALESAYLKASNRSIHIDISESNIQNAGLKYYMFGLEDTIEGGYSVIGASYMLSWLGVITSEDNIYDELGKIGAIYDNGSKYQINNVVILPIRQNITDNQYLKEALVKYGAISLSVFSPNSKTYNKNTKAAYYYNQKFGKNTNHAVTLVGWNDTFSKENFINTPPGDGAWIVKNSWGSHWGDKGYYYVSYYDTAFATGKTPIAFLIDGKQIYQKNYQYDIISRVKFNDYHENVRYSNKFESIGEDLIAAVGTYFNKSGEDYLINIYVNDKLVHTQKGISSYSGYETIKLENMIPIKENDTFIVEMSTGSIVPLSTNSRQPYPKNTSLVKSATEQLDNSAQGIVACLKAYTIPNNTNITLNNTKLIVQYFDETGDKLANSNVTLKINDTLYDRTTDEEGVLNFDLELSEGEYPVTIVNPVYDNEYNVTITTDNKQTADINQTGDAGETNTTNQTDNSQTNNKTPKTSNQSKTSNTHKTYKNSNKKQTHAIREYKNNTFHTRYFTLNRLNNIFDHNFINGHLIIYIDGKIVFNDTVNDNQTMILFEIIRIYQGQHELKVEYTVGNNTQTFTKNVTIY